MCDVVRPKPVAAANSSACGHSSAVGLTSILDREQFFYFLISRLHAKSYIRAFLLFADSETRNSLRIMTQHIICKYDVITVNHCLWKVECDKRFLDVTIGPEKSFNAPEHENTQYKISAVLLGN